VNIEGILWAVAAVSGALCIAVNSVRILLVLNSRRPEPLPHRGGGVSTPSVLVPPGRCVVGWVRGAGDVWLAVNVLV
jgi:hypothetical protein